jgi:hypothetical protein
MSKKTPQLKGRKSRLPQNIPQLTPDSNFRLTGVSPNVNFRPTTLDYQSPQPPQQQNNPFAINRPFIPPYQNNQQPQQSHSRRSQPSVYGSPESVYRPTMDSSTYSYSSYQRYSPVNHINIELVISWINYATIQNFMLEPVRVSHTQMVGFDGSGFVVVVGCFDTVE